VIWCGVSSLFRKVSALPTVALIFAGRKANDAMTMECFFRNGSFFSSNRCFSGMTFIFSKAPAFSIASMVVSPYTVSFEAPKFTLALKTPSRCFTFFSNFVAQPAQVNPCTR
jgi:hypothetical protein